MIRLHKSLVTAAFLIALLPAGLAAQERSAPAMSPEIQQWLAELQEIQSQLGPLQERALQEPALQQAHTSLVQSVEQAMTQADPSLRDLPQQAERLQTRAQAAQEAGDQAQLQRIIGEAQELQHRVVEAQMAAIQRPEIAAQAEAFQASLHARMVALDPRAQALILRHGELERNLRAAVQGQ